MEKSKPKEVEGHCRSSGAQSGERGLWSQSWGCAAGLCWSQPHGPGEVMPPLRASDS